jgi:hypothetical protein
VLLTSASTTRRGACAVVAEPEADRVEDEAEDARHGLQHDLAVAELRQALRAQQRWIHGSSGEPSRAPWSRLRKLNTLPRSMPSSGARRVAASTVAGAGKRWGR